jgi:hypothetical protein
VRLVHIAFFCATGKREQKPAVQQRDAADVTAADSLDGLYVVKMSEAMLNKEYRRVEALITSQRTGGRHLPNMRTIVVHLPCELV